MKKTVMSSSRQRTARKRGKQVFPPGWDAQRVGRVLEHYESQTDEEAAAEDDAAFRAEGITLMAIPTELVPEVDRLIARRRAT